MGRARKEDDLFTDRRLLVARLHMDMVNPAGCLAGTFIAAKYVSSTQIPYGISVMATNRDKPTKIPPSRSPGTGSSELTDQQQSITPPNQGLLSGLPEHLFTSLFSRATPVRLKTNEVLFLAGDTGNGCYHVEDGLLKVTMVSRAGSERILAFLGSGAIVGEMSIIDGLPRSASVVAVRPAVSS